MAVTGRWDSLQGRLNEFMGSGQPAWRAARQQLQRLLASGEGAVRDDLELRQRAIHPAVGAGFVGGGGAGTLW